MERPPPAQASQPRYETEDGRGDGCRAELDAGAEIEIENEPRPGLDGKRKRRPRPGRAKRRREAKVRAILRAEAALFGGGGISADPAAGEAALVAAGTPLDRHAAPPGAVARRRDARRRAGGGEGKGEEGGDSDDDDGLDPTDQRRLAAQLGFVPGNAVAVAARLGDCPELRPLLSGAFLGGGGTAAARDPAVLRLYPLAMRDAYAGGRADGRRFKSRKRGSVSEGRGEAAGAFSSAVVEPFPTMYWLTDPRLRVLVSRVEVSTDLGVRGMEERIAADPAHGEAMARAHLAYGTERWELLTEGDRADVERSGWEGALGKGRGVAGIAVGGRRRRAGGAGPGLGPGVKCLHAHAAHYLAGGTDNVVGRWTMREVGRMLRERERERRAEMEAEAEAEAGAEAEGGDATAVPIAAAP